MVGRGRGRRGAGRGPKGGPDVQIGAESDPALSPGRRRDLAGKGRALLRAGLDFAVLNSLPTSLPPCTMLQLCSKIG